ncbi:MAG TPA: hypothetical protein VJV05_08215 [Pyrinomonadaceae bacterium]|nr:hypothetical protein [Pyrinomonadaceae bacterium]
MMKRLLSVIFTIAISLQLGFAQKSEREMTSLREAQREAVQAKREAASLANIASPADFNDTASFGKNVKFLGSLYAGTLFVYRSCDPQILLDELQTTLAPDDHCIVHTNLTPMTTTTVFDPVWQITLPANSVDNVIYPLLNNTVGFDAFPSDPGSNNGYGAGFASIRYSPVVTIESTALNDPAAIDPNTNLPMNGSFTTTLPGTRVKGFAVATDDLFSENDSYASVAGRGFSRTYFAALGLPNSVINNLFKRSMTLKFGIRADVNGPVQQAFFSYQFRLMGN